MATCGDSNLKSYSQIDLLAGLCKSPGLTRRTWDLDSAREERRLDNYFEHVEGSPLSVDDRWIKGLYWIPELLPAARAGSRASSVRSPSLSNLPFISTFVATSVAPPSPSSSSDDHLQVRAPGHHEGIRVYSESGTGTLDRGRRTDAPAARGGDPPTWTSVPMAALRLSLAQSKYIRGQPTSFAAHHLAYIPSLPDTLQDIYRAIYGVPASAAMLTFLKRELMQAVCSCLWTTVSCTPDYPEKMLLTCLRFFARCPCPRCRINKDKIVEMGTRNDLYRRNWVRQDDTDTIYRIKITRRWVLEDGLALTSKYIARVLDPLSLTPTRSAYSIRLREHGFNVYSLFAPDLMHEFELGVWKSIWIHLLRILYAVGEDAIQRLNERFRQTPAFGRSTIRRFGELSNQGKLAARDYEARLQCFMPAYENLLVGPASRRDNGIVLDLGFDLATWHCLAKLREHTEISLAGLDAKTVDVGAPFERLPRRHAGRAAATEAKRKYFNYTTYKFHAMRDYAPAIRAIAASDNFNTQVGELEHRHVKRFYARTNKVRAAFQIAQHMRRAEKLRIIKRRVDAARAAQEGAAPSATPTDPVPAEEPARSAAAVPQEPLPYTADPLARYHIAESQREWDDLSLWVATHAADPAFQVQDFVIDLRNHILSRLNVALPLGEEDYSITDRSRVVFVKNRIYWHRALRVNYTTYDRRRTQESINPRTHGDVLLLATNKNEGDHPYWYARIVKVFHVNVRLVGAYDEEPKRVDVLWARWFQYDQSTLSGFGAKRLPRITFVPPQCNADQFAFLDPADVVRGAHIIPAFAHGRTSCFLGPSNVRNNGSDLGIDMNMDTDFKYYYVNIFADRDMFMRFYGGGIGHQGLRLRSDTAFDEDPYHSDWQDIDEDDMDELDATVECEPLPREDVQEIHSEQDVLALVPELLSANGTLNPLLDDDIGREDDTHAEDGQHIDSEDEELNAHADEDDEPERAADDSAGNSAAAGDVLEEEDEDAEDEYAIEGYGQL
ncbi:hypothetical protein C8Q70DRAFT_932905 [Cubamyces menziesii]|nr:hypothetical protein C8Q70DRAFT_932905 [Cubamyces menziesii]